ncbi:MAG: hypothetical protein K0Q55_1202 [Verrucomicrobia bacterium]|nr:hypothetical protein [Verrucomicrobiota bacterium]
MAPHRGSSVEFAEYRNYVPGDDLRRLDWRVFGRTDRFYMKEFEADTNLRCYLVLDTSASMGFTGQHGSRLDYAKKIAASLAYLTIQQGDAAGLVCVGEKVNLDIPAKRNPAHLQLIYDTLEQVEAKGTTNLVQALHDLAEKVRRRALIIVLTDGFEDAESLLNCFQHLRFQKHDLVMFQLLDRMEMEFRFDRPVRFNDLESSFNLVTEPNSIRDEYLAQLHKHLARLKQGCHQFNADYRQVILDESYEKLLADFLSERANASASRG